MSYLLAEQMKNRFRVSNLVVTLGLAKILKYLVHEFPT